MRALAPFKDYPLYFVEGCNPEIKHAPPPYLGRRVYSVYSAARAAGHDPHVCLACLGYEVFAAKSCVTRCMAKSTFGTVAFPRRARLSKSLKSFRTWAEPLPGQEYRRYPCRDGGARMSSGLARNTLVSLQILKVSTCFLVLE